MMKLILHINYYELLQVSKIRKALANGSSANINFQKLNYLKYSQE